jgi:FkbM family methyltransferase
VLIPFKSLKRKYKLKVDGVLHLGAHLGEEAQDYFNMGVRNVIWVEANPELIPRLRDNVGRFSHTILNYLVADEDGKQFTFHVTNNFMSSSVLELGTHKKSSPDVHYTHDLQLEGITVDSMVQRHGLTGFNFLNMDLQGAEKLALIGASETLNVVDYVYSEINTEEVYLGNALVGDLDDILKPYGFELVESSMAGNAGWGDGFWIKR